MSLTPEERRRIYEEEKARIEAQDQVRAARTKGRTGCGKGCGLVVLVIAGLALIGMLSSSFEQAFERARQSRTPAPTQPAPQQGRISQSGATEFGLMGFDSNGSQWQFMHRVFTNSGASGGQYVAARDPLAECLKWARDLTQTLGGMSGAGIGGCMNLRNGDLYDYSGKLTHKGSLP